MKVTNIMTMEKYDKYCIKNLAGKLPDWNNKDYRRRVGDSIYDFSASNAPILRESVHNESNLETDLKGENALLSDHFWYFGNKPVQLPAIIRDIAHPHPGHKSKANTSYVSEFVEWIELQEKEQAVPALKDEIMKSVDSRGKCAARDKIDNENDEIC